MRQLRLIIFTIPFFMLSCASPYLKDYEPIKVFLEHEKIDSKKFYILQKEQISSKTILRIFNGGEGAEHTIDPLDGTDCTNVLFNDKHWRKFYKKHIKDTIGYWEKEDFTGYNFALENKKLLFSKAYRDKYPNDFINHQIIFLSQPLYYWKKKYILFSYQIGLLYGGSSTEVIIMKKEKGKWIIVQRIGDYIHS